MQKIGINYFIKLLCLLLSSNLLAQAPAEYFTNDRSKFALTRVIANLSDEVEDSVVLGRSFFNLPWVEAPASTTARDGLGPLFNANSCLGCHKHNGGGSAILKQGDIDRSIVVKLSNSMVNEKPTLQNKIGLQPDPVYGRQLAVNAIHGVPFEGKPEATIKASVFSYPDGSQVKLSKPEIRISSLNYGDLSPGTRVNLRRAPALIGLGLIEKIPESQILARADHDDRNQDGISGRANKVWSHEANSQKLGKFGWKAGMPTVVEQTADAMFNDMSLTSKWFQQENCSASQHDCLSAYKSPQVDVPYFRLQAISVYLKNLKTPVDNRRTNLSGKTLFRSIGCSACHRGGYVTSDGISVNPYSDFLLHDMGPDLAGGGALFLAQPEEWRTAPLWGIGLAKTINPEAGFLHDGRATTLEQSILWHGGEAEASRQAFADLNRTQREELLFFLRTL